MANIVIEGILISKNRKTGCSVNVDQCTPTPWCRPHCYRCFRDEAIIAENGWDTTPNSGPITWRTQRESYKRNERAIILAGQEGRLDTAAARIAARLKDPDPLRGNGTGDLFPALCELYARIAFHGKPVFIFSRRPDMILELLDVCDSLELEPGRRPFVLGSIDPSTTLCQCHQLVEATAAINGRPVLAYATDKGGGMGCGEVRAHRFSEYIQVVFGYHTNFVKTVLGHEKECPATAGKHVKCNECRRCYGAE
jgi:hypothetical protein